jgi:hypothetical protein
MKKLINWIAGFFDASSVTSSSKRLVGIAGAATLFVTLYSNSHSEHHIAPSDTLVWADVVVICTALGLASVREIADLMKSFKGGGAPTTSPEPQEPKNEE